MWNKKEMSPEDRISHAFNLLNAFLGNYRHIIIQQQFVELQRVLNILSDNPTLDEDRQWANEEIEKWINNQQEMPAENVRIMEEKMLLKIQVDINRLNNEVHELRKLIYPLLKPWQK